MAAKLEVSSGRRQMAALKLRLVGGQSSSGCGNGAGASCRRRRGTRPGDGDRAAPVGCGAGLRRGLERRGRAMKEW
ncbi:unnamed protein product [Linum trigynum]|uniref:Uncharacterized protein n=1 Tax=Linum trigynum TaxID=586398 RepID=A0AAV2D511_9ROSI